MDDLVKVTRATEDDREFVVSSFLSMLTEGGSHGCVIPMAATRENVEVFYSMVIEPAIKEGDPVLIASRDGEQVGLLVWSEYRGPLDLGRRIAYGYGCWVSPRHRRLGVSSRLRSHGIDMLRKRGVQCIDGAAELTNEAALASAQSSGFVAHSAIVRFCL